MTSVLGSLHVVLQICNTLISSLQTLVFWTCCAFHRAHALKVQSHGLTATLDSQRHLNHNWHVQQQPNSDVQLVMSGAHCGLQAALQCREDELGGTGRAAPG